MTERFPRVYTLHALLHLLSSKLFSDKAPCRSLLPTQLRNSNIIALDIPTFYPVRFRLDNGHTAFSKQYHGYNSATCGSKGNSNSPPVTETTKKVHRSKDKMMQICYHYGKLLLDQKLQTNDLMINCAILSFFQTLVSVTLACRAGVILASKCSLSYC